MPYWRIEDDCKDILCRLVDEELIEIYSSNYEINPHIKRLPQRLDKDKQKEEILENADSVVLYPTSKYMKQLNIINATVIDGNSLSA